MTEQEAKTGTRIKSLVEFTGVPKGTEGVIDEDYGNGVMIAWDKPNKHSAALPPGYKKHNGEPYIKTGILRDGFSKKDELQYLEVV